MLYDLDSWLDLSIISGSPCLGTVRYALPALGFPLTPTSPSLGEQLDLEHPDTKYLCCLKTVSSPEMQSATQKFVTCSSVYRNNVSSCWELLSLVLASQRMVADLVFYL